MFDMRRRQFIKLLGGAASNRSSTFNTRRGGVVR
jgi:hypothetical protein